MENIFQKGEKIAQTALGLLRKNVKAPGLFTHKLGVADFRGAEGDVVGVKRPAVLVARDKGWRNDDEIIVDKLVNTKIQVELNAHPYSAVELSPEEETLDEVDYVRDVQKPQVDAILVWFENLIVGTLRAANFVASVVFNTESSNARESDPRKVAIRARKLFQKAHVPTEGRYWLVGADVSEAVASHDKLLEVDKAGIPEALREGVVGKLGGFVIVELDSLREDESFFVHETAIAIATVAPVVPNGVAKGGGVAAGQGLAVTQIWDYDSKRLKDRSVVHAFAGASIVTDPEVDEETGALVLDENNKPQLEFKRAVRVVFGAASAGTGATYTVQVTGSPTGGTYTLSVDGDETAPVAHNATNAVIAAAINALPGVSGARVTGQGATKTITFDEGVTLVKGTTAFTGGTSPNVTVASA